MVVGETVKPPSENVFIDAIKVFEMLEFIT
jgi:hypothetical protein